MASARILLLVAAFAAALGGLLALRATQVARSEGATGGGSARAPAAPPPAASEGAAAGRVGSAITPETTTLDGDDSFRLLVFPVRLAGARLRVLDLGMTRDLAAAIVSTGATLVVNGGFFDRANRAEGLVISGGATLSPRSDTLGGGVVTVTEGRASLAAAEGFVAPPGTDFAVQARPRLVVGGKSGIASDDGRTAERTALCLREEGRVLEVVVARGEAAGGGPTLALLADMLVSRGCEGALNLDGGPSTGVAWREGGEGSEGGEVRALGPRGPLRHAIAVWGGPTGGAGP